jgi:hypothetical protein
MIPADGDFYADFKTAEGGWPAAGRKVIAWDDEGHPLVLGEKGLVRPEALSGLVFVGVRELPKPLEPLPGPHSYFGDEDDREDVQQATG